MDDKPAACYELDYALARLRDAIEFAEIENDFQPVRKWANEVEKSANQIKKEDRNG